MRGEGFPIDVRRDSFGGGRTIFHLLDEMSVPMSGRWDGGRGNKSWNLVTRTNERDGNKLPKNLQPAKLRLHRFTIGVITDEKEAILLLAAE